MACNPPVISFMRSPIINSSRPVRRLLFYLGVVLLSGLPDWVAAHPMPNSVVLLDIRSDGVVGKLQMPLSELQLAFGHDVAQHPEMLVRRLGPELRAYIQAHLRPVSPDGRAWTVAVGDLAVQSTVQPYTGPYYELTARVQLRPSTGVSPRRFRLNYDVIIHQLVTHKALVSIRQDWEAGQFGEQPAEVGVIQLDVPSNTIPPLVINQESGSLWRGFRGMVELGVQHIAEGTDHLLFLLVLLLPAPLVVSQKRWGQFGGARYSLVRLLWIVTAFTIGHSITLLAGAIGWLRLPSQPVEILIAVSILVSAVHALRPLFPSREAWVAAGFGLVHGLAFANTLTDLKLDAGRMALSILGFNIGIELMQLAVIGLTIPWLILLSRTPAYVGVRITGAILAGVAALAWITERVLGSANSLTALVEQMAQHAPYLLGVLALFTLISVYWEHRNKATSRVS